MKIAAKRALNLPIHANLSNATHFDTIINVELIWIRLYYRVAATNIEAVLRLPF